MQRRLLIVGCGLALLLIGLGTWRVQNQVAYDPPPPNATSVRISRHGLFEVHVNYRIPAAWTLSDLYAYHSARGWVRDLTAERSLRPDSPTTVYAVFTRRRLFGLVAEIAIIGVPVSSRSGVNVRQVRCFKIEPWTGCL